MVNYNNGKVYKIWSPNGDKIYIGSTTKDYLSKRMVDHRKKYNNWKKNTENTYYTAFILFDEYGIDNCKIELLETKSCQTRDELTQIEGKYIRELECVNKNIAGRTAKIYFEDNKERVLEVAKIYYQNNKELIANKSIIYREKNKDKIQEYMTNYREGNKDKIKAKREDDKDKIKEYKKNYYQINKEKIKEKRRLRYEKNKK